MLSIVSHDNRACNTCSVWVHHYTSSALDGERSLTDAETQRASVIRSGLIAKNAALQQNNDSLQQANASLRCELDAVREDLDKTRRRLSSAEDEIIRMHNENEDLECGSDRTINDLRDQVNSLKFQLRNFEPGHTPHRRKAPRRGSRTPSPSRSRHTSSRASRPPSLMAEDRDGSSAHPTVAQPHPSRLTVMHSAASSSTASPPFVEPPPPSAGADLASRLADAASLAPSTPTPLSAAPRYVATPFIQSVGFLSSLPVLTFSDHRYDCTTLDVDGGIDYTAHSHFIYALGGMTADGPAWTTTLVTREQLLDDAISQAIAMALPLPPLRLVVGGRNGVLISPHKDPTSERGVTALFTTPSQHRKALGYVNRIKYTPPELRDEFHQRALDRWTELQATRRREREERGESAPRRHEPSPYADNFTWKRWLKDMRERPQSEGPFKYIGIPHVCQGYQTAHLDGAKALLSFLPHSKGGITRGPIRGAFLRAAATLFSVPEQYQQVLARLGQDISSTHVKRPYNATQFGDENHLGVNEVARYLATVGVTTAEAEKWRAWATAYIDMELEEHPDDVHAVDLRRAKQQARARIDSDPDLVLSRVHPDSPGYYNPVLENSRALRKASREARQSEAGSSTNAEAGPSSVILAGDEHTPPVHPDGAEEDEDLPGLLHIVFSLTWHILVTFLPSGLLRAFGV